MAKKGAKLSASAAAKRAAKARITRCVNSCNASGGAKAAKRKRGSPKTSAARAGRARGTKALGAWRAHLSVIWAGHKAKGLSYKQAMADASASWQQMKAAGQLNY